MLLFEQLKWVRIFFYSTSFFSSSVIMALIFLREIIITIVMMMRHKTQGRRIQMRKKGRSRKAFFFSHLCPDLLEWNETFFIWLILATKLTVLLRLMSHLLNNCLFYKASACALRLNIFLKITNLCHRKHDWFSFSHHENNSIFEKKYPTSVRNQSMRYSLLDPTLFSRVYSLGDFDSP